MAASNADRGLSARGRIEPASTLPRSNRRRFGADDRQSRIEADEVKGFVLQSTLAAFQSGAPTRRRSPDAEWP